MKSGFDDWKTDVNNKLADYEEGIRAKFSGKKEDLKETVDNLLSKSSYKTEEAITFWKKNSLSLKTKC